MSESKEGVNVRVVVRTRPLNSDEKREGTAAVVHSAPSRNEIHVSAGVKRDKRFTFDKVYGQFTTQEQLFKESVTPIIDEVMDGFNCTVFAYGQTGTGKTYTMEGNMDDTSSDHAGIIPRSIREIFARLEAKSESEFSIRVSFLELYNEQLDDLLTAEDSTTKLRVIEDVRKGVFCQNLEEVLVHSTEELYGIIRSAIKKRRVAETMMNKASSRSHCIFTLTIHTKEITPEGEDLLKVGKLNLVDLAGSECVGRSGAKRDRAREAGNINQSLLTLGRVITALVEHHPHVPYRDSKLTRLLQDSLGGSTKTCIIATLSPSIMNLEETMSTLDYAHRAKNIRNRPQVNQKMTKRVLLNEYSKEIEKLRNELTAAREKNGVYMPLEKYEMMLADAKGKESSLGELEEEMVRRTSEFEELKKLFGVTSEELEALKAEHEATEAKLEATSTSLTETKMELDGTKTALEEAGEIISVRTTTEEKLHSEAMALRSTLDTSLFDVHGLHAKIDRKSEVERSNAKAQSAYEEDLKDSLTTLQTELNSYRTQQEKHSELLRSSMETFTLRKEEESKAVTSAVDDIFAAVQRARTEQQAMMAAAASAASGRWGEVHKNTDASLADLVRAQDDMLAAIADKLRGVHAQLTTHTSSIKTWASSAKSLVASSTDEMTKFAESHIQSIHDSKQAVSTFAAESARELEEMSSKAQKHADAARSASETAASTFMDTMKHALDAFVSTHSDSTNAALEHARSSYEQRSSAVKAFNREAAEAFDARAASMATQRDATARAASELAIMVDEHVASSTTSVDAIHESVTGVSTFAEAEVSARGSSIGVIRDCVGKAKDLAVKAATDDVAKADTASCAATESLKAQFDGAHEMVEDHANGDKRGVEFLQAAHADSCSLSDSFCSVQEGHVKRMRGNASTFFTSSLRKDVATGSTPAKKEYQFPKSLTTTSPHERIIGRFRERLAGESKDSPVATRLFEFDGVDPMDRVPTPPAQVMEAMEAMETTPVSAVETSVDSIASVDTEKTLAEGSPKESNPTSPAESAPEVDSEESKPVTPTEKPSKSATKPSPRRAASPASKVTPAKIASPAAGRRIPSSRRQKRRVDKVAKSPARSSGIPAPRTRASKRIAVRKTSLLGDATNNL